MRSTRGKYAVAFSSAAVSLGQAVSEGQVATVEAKGGTVGRYSNSTRSGGASNEACSATLTAGLALAIRGMMLHRPPSNRRCCSSEGGGGQELNRILPDSRKRSYGRQHLL